MIKLNYEAVIGLEIHSELKTATKIFCGCATTFGAEQNTHVCPVCLGLPGVLPTINRRVVEFAIETEIKQYLNQISQNVIEIGKRLIQAKSLVQHGQWLNWLEQNFQLKERMARNFMQCAQRFGNRHSYADLNQSQMITLLALPNSEETEKFIEQKEAEGTPVSNMSVKTLRNEIKLWNSSIKELDTNQLSESQPSGTIDISDHIASQNQDSVDQPDSRACSH